MNFFLCEAKVYEQTRICFICAQKTYLFRNEKETFVRITFVNLGITSIYLSVLYQNYILNSFHFFYFYCYFSLSTQYTYIPAHRKKHGKVNNLNQLKYLYDVEYYMMWIIFRLLVWRKMVGVLICVTCIE